MRIIVKAVDKRDVRVKEVSIPFCASDVVREKSFHVKISFLGI